MRVIDADKAKLVLDWNLVGDAADAACKVIDDAPTVDAVVVTRCKDCKYSCKDRNGRTCEGYWYELSEFAVPVKDDGFCSYGKPKEG